MSGNTVLTDGTIVDEHGTVLGNIASHDVDTGLPIEAPPVNFDDDDPNGMPPIEPSHPKPAKQTTTTSYRVLVRTTEPEDGKLPVFFLLPTVYEGNREQVEKRAAGELIGSGVLTEGATVFLSAVPARSWRETPASLPVSDPAERIKLG